MPQICLLVNRSHGIANKSGSFVIYVFDGPRFDSTSRPYLLDSDNRFMILYFCTSVMTCVEQQYHSFPSIHISTIRLVINLWMGKNDTASVGSTFLLHLVNLTSYLVQLDQQLKGNTDPGLILRLNLICWIAIIDSWSYIIVKVLWHVLVPPSYYNWLIWPAI